MAEDTRFKDAQRTAGSDLDRALPQNAADPLRRHRSVLGGTGPASTSVGTANAAGGGGRDVSGNDGDARMMSGGGGPPNGGEAGAGLHVSGTTGEGESFTGTPTAPPPTGSGPGVDAGID